MSYPEKDISHDEGESAPEEPALSQALQAAFIEFLQQQPAKDFSRNLRRMLIEYLMSESGRSSVYIVDTLAGLDLLFDLLDVAEEEWK
jgi:hypothetical protein